MSRRIEHEKNNRNVRVARSDLIEYEQKVRLDPGGRWHPLDLTVHHDKVLESKARRRLIEHEKKQLLRKLMEYVAHLPKQSDRQRESFRKYAMEDVLEILIQLPRTRYLPDERRTIEEAIKHFKIEIQTPCALVQSENA